MRSDYFTTTEFAEKFHVAQSTALKYANKPGYYVGIKTGQKRGNTIIPKAQFFDWYFKAYNSGTIKNLIPFTRVSHSAVIEAYREYIDAKSKNMELMRREAIKNKRPAYRRKGSYHES